MVDYWYMRTARRRINVGPSICLLPLSHNDSYMILLYRDIFAKGSKTLSAIQEIKMFSRCEF